MEEGGPIKPLVVTGGATRVRLALTLGGGAARGLAHIGVLEVLEREGIRPDCIVGSSMGALIGSLSAKGLSARDIFDLAREFGFPRWFIPGGLVKWDVVFRSAARVLSRVTFEDLTTPLVVTAVDLEAGTQVILHAGPVLPAIRASCAVPGILPPIKLGARWLVDGGLLNLLPVDVAWMAEPDIVIAVKVGATRARPMPRLNWRLTSLLSVLGHIVPNPGTAKVAFEVLVRAAEITLDRQTALAAAMTNPELLIEPDLGDIGLRDFNRLEDAVKAGRCAAEEVLPKLDHLLSSPSCRRKQGEIEIHLRFDPVCAMVISPRRARASVRHEGSLYYFCSENCRDVFERDPDRYLAATALSFQPPPRDTR